MTSPTISVALGLLLGLAAHGCGSSAPAEPAAAAVETELTKPSPTDAPTQPAPTPNQPPAGEPATPAKPTATDMLCGDLCERTASLNCGTVQACKSACQKVAKSDICTTEVLAMLTCAASKPASSFRCDPETKTPALRDGQCSAEQGAIAECFSTGGM